MSLSSQNVQVKLHNVIDVHNCTLNWTIQGRDYDTTLRIYTSPSFCASKNSIPWSLQVRLAKSQWCSVDLCVAAGGVCGEIAGHVKTIFQTATKTKVEELSFITPKVEKQNTSTKICGFANVGGYKGEDITITCEVTFFELSDVISRVLSNEQVSVPSADLHCSSPTRNACFAKLYLNETHSDVWLNVNGSQYAAHKTILAACSDVFGAMFKHDMQENQLCRVEISDIDEQTFLEALRYMYTGQVENLDTLAYDLVKVADRYDIKGLRELCGTVLHGKLIAETAIKSLLFADSYNVPNLKAAAIEFILTHSKDVREARNEDEWKELTDRPNLMKDMFELFMNK